MRIMLALSAVVLTLFIGNRLARAGIFSSAIYVLDSLADDPSVSTSPTAPFTSDKDSGSDSSTDDGTISGEFQVAATEGQSSATGLAKYKMGKGVISLFASGDAISRKPAATTFDAGANFRSLVSGTLSDVLQFTFPSGTSKIKANASFQVSANLVVGGEGASGTNGKMSDLAKGVKTSHSHSTGVLGVNAR